MADLSTLTPEALLWAGVALLAVAMAVLAAVVVAVGVSWWWASRRRGAGRAVDRLPALRDLGYEAVGPGQWRMELPRTQLCFEEAPDGGWRWTVALPRYNTLALRIAEQGAPGPGLGQLFESRVPELDQRFVLSSPLPAQTLALVMSPKVGHALLAMPWLRLELSGDELVIGEGREGLRRLAAQAPGSSPVALEVELHQRVTALVLAILGTLYSRLTGTLLPEHR